MNSAPRNNIIAVIPARSGSKSLPHKNIRMLHGRPLLYWSILQAKRCPLITDVWVNTDSGEYAEIAESLGATVPFLRSGAAATDQAMEWDVLRDLKEKIQENGIQKPDYLVWLRPTSPLRKVAEIEGCILKILDCPEFTSVLSVAEQDGRLFVKKKDLLEPVFPHPEGQPVVRRQELPAYYRIFGIDVFAFGNIDRFGDRYLGDRIGYFEIDKVSGYDIDDRLDFKIVESLMNDPQIFAEYFGSTRLAEPDRYPLPASRNS